MDFKPAAAPRQPSASKVVEVKKEGVKIIASPLILTVRQKTLKKIKKSRKENIYLNISLWNKYSEINEYGVI